MNRQRFHRVVARQMTQAPRWLQWALIGAMSSGLQVVAWRSRPQVRRELVAAADTPVSVHRTYDYFARQFVDAMAHSVASPPRTDLLLSVDEQTKLQSLAQRNGLILAFPHLGDFTSLLDVVTQTADHSAVILKDQGSSMLGTLLRDTVERAGIEPLWVGAGRDNGAAVIRAVEVLRNGGTVLISSDYVSSDTSRSDGISVELAGSRRFVGAGPALLAQRSGASVVSAAILYDRANRRCVFGEDLMSGFQMRDETIVELTERIALSTSALIRQAPEQWANVGDLMSRRPGSLRNDSGDLGH